MQTLSGSGVARRLAVFSVSWTSAAGSPHWERVRPPRVRADSRISADHLLNVLFLRAARAVRRRTRLVPAGERARRRCAIGDGGSNAIVFG